MILGSFFCEGAAGTKTFVILLLDIWFEQDCCNSDYN